MKKVLQSNQIKSVCNVLHNMDQNFKSYIIIIIIIPPYIISQYSDGEMTSSIFKIIFTTCVASNICCCFPIKVSNTFCSRISFVPVSLQSIPQQGLFSYKTKNKITSLCYYFNFQSHSFLFFFL